MTELRLQLKLLIESLAFSSSPEAILLLVKFLTYIFLNIRLKFSPVFNVVHTCGEELLSLATLGAIQKR